MFEDILNYFSKNVSERDLKITNKHYQKLKDDFLPILGKEARPLIGASEAIFGKKIFSTSDFGMLSPRLKEDQNGLVSMPISLGHLYIKTERDTEIDSSLSIDISLFTFNLTPRNKIKPASIYLEFNICGDKEGKAFQELFKNYRRPMQQLIESNKIEFFSSYYSEIVGKYKGNNTMLKIEEYYSDPNIDNIFSLNRNFVGTVEASEIINVFLIFSALYDSCNGYLGKRKALDLFAKHSSKLI